MSTPRDSRLLQEFPVLTFFVDEDHGVARARASGDLSLLGEFLESDLQSNIEWIDESIAAVQEVRAGVRSTFVRDGNTILLTASPAKVSLEHLYASFSAELELESVEAALLDWRRFIESLRQS
jgi:uncharacterized protein YacL (UPF0231 family)